MKLILISLLVLLVSSQTIQTTTDILTIQSNQPEIIINPIKVGNCPITRMLTNHQFDLVDCSFQNNATNLSINMTYKVIDDSKGARANRVQHTAKYAASNTSIIEPNQTISQVNHHLGDLLYSKININLSKLQYPKQGNYFWYSNICYYYCTPNPYTHIPTCGCDLGYNTEISFTVKRGQFVMPLQSQQIKDQ